MYVEDLTVAKRGTGYSAERVANNMNIINLLCTGNTYKCPYPKNSEARNTSCPTAYGHIITEKPGINLLVSFLVDYPHYLSTMKAYHACHLLTSISRFHLSL